MTEKRFYINGVGISDRERKRLYDLKTVDGFISVRDLLNELSEENEQLKSRVDYLDRSILTERSQIVKLQGENEQLKQSVNNLKDTIIKITLAYQRKYDRTIVDLVDEVHEEDITDLIKELKE